MHQLPLWITLVGFMLTAMPLRAQEIMPLVNDAAAADAGLMVYWQADLPLVENDYARDIYLVDEAVYVATMRGNLYAVRADTGLIRWAESVVATDIVLQRPRHLLTPDFNGDVLLTDAGTVHVLDRYTGELKQSFRPKFPLSTPAVGFENLVFMGSAEGRFYSLMLEPRYAAGAIQRWQVVVDGPVTGYPALYGFDKIMFGTSRGTLYSCTALNKKFHWKVELDGAIRGDVGMDDTGAYVATAGQSLYKINGDEGSIVWRRQLPCELPEGPVAVDKAVYQRCRGDGILAIDATSGADLWRLPVDGRFAARLGSRDAVLSDDGRLLLVDPSNGEVVDTVAIPEASATYPNGTNDAAYILSRDGRIACLRDKDAPYLRFEQVQKAEETLRVPPPKEKAAGEGDAEADAEKAGEKSDDPFRSRWDKSAGGN